MSCVHKTNKLAGLVGNRKVGQIGWTSNKLSGRARQRWIWSGSTKDQAPRAGPTKILCYIFNHSLVDSCRCSGEFAESSDMVSDVRATCNISVHKLTKEGAIGEALFVCQNMFLGVFEGTLFFVERADKWHQSRYH